MSLVDVEREGLLEPRGERDHPVLASLAVDDADAAGVEVHIIDADGDEFTDAGAGVEQGLDQHDVGAATGSPDGLVPGVAVVTERIWSLRPGAAGADRRPRARAGLGWCRPGRGRRRPAPTRR